MFRKSEYSQIHADEVDGRPVEVPLEIGQTSHLRDANMLRIVQNEDRRTHVAIALPSLGAGGCERAVSLLANAWAERGWQISIITLDEGNTPAYFPLHPEVTIVQIGMPNRRTNRISAAIIYAIRIRRLRQAFKQLRPDVIISFLTRMNVLSLAAASGTGIPVVTSERNNPELQSFGPIWEALRRALYPSAFGLVTMTRGALDCFPASCRRHGWVIPPEVELPAARPPYEPRYTTITAVGRLVPQKGFDLLVEAFARTAADHPEWDLVIWGEGPLRAELEGLRDRLGLDDRIHLPGVTRTPGAWTKKAGIFVFSSRFEGWGNALSEAMAAGLPVISFDCNYGPAEMITHGRDGLLVPVGDVVALSAALSRLIDNGALRKGLADEAAKSAGRFVRENIMRAWDDVVASALGGPSK